MPTARTKKEPICRYFKQCQACTYIADPYEYGLKKKFELGLDELGKKLDLKSVQIFSPAPAKEKVGYRHLAKLAVRKNPSFKESGRSPLQIGLFAQGSHNVVEIANCPVHAPGINDLVFALKKELEASPLSYFDEKSASGYLSYIVLRSAHKSNDIMLTFVVKDSSHAGILRQIVKRLLALGHPIQSAHLSLKENSGNQIFGEKMKKIFGDNRLQESLLDVDYGVSPGSFFQINPWQALKIYSRIQEFAGQPDNKKKRALDLYCGVGQISLQLARAGFLVKGIEENPKAIEDAKLNAKNNALDGNTEFSAGRVEDILKSEKEGQCSLIVANPSRRGIAEEARSELKKLISKNPGAIFIYLSCEVVTLARDLSDFCASGMKVRQLESFDMFPYTNKLEWLAVLSL